MNVFEYLSSATGIEFQHAIILLVLAIAGYLDWLVHREVKANARRLDNHIDQHAMDLVEHEQHHTTSSGL